MTNPTLRAWTAIAATLHEVRTRAHQDERGAVSLEYVLVAAGAAAVAIALGAIIMTKVMGAAEAIPTGV